MLTIGPLSPHTADNARARGLVAIGYYEETSPNTFRLTEAGFQLVMLWMPHVISALADRGRMRERLVELERENLDLCVYIEQVRQGLAPLPSSPAWLDDEEEGTKGQ